MAGDRQFTQSSGLKWKGSTKIFKFNGHPDTYPVDFLMGFAGTADDMITACEFFSNPESFKKVPVIKGLTGLVLTAKEEIFMFTSLRNWLRVDTPYAAIGSGSPFALGALANGATLKEAIKIAGKSDIYTGLGITTLSLK